MKRVKDLAVVFDSLDEVAMIVGDCDDWVTIKKELLKCLPSNLRKLFSRRHPITKEQQTNALEFKLINMYNDRTGVKPVVRSIEERRNV